jgi:hypothetical protein
MILKTLFTNKIQNIEDTLNKLGNNNNDLKNKKSFTQNKSNVYSQQSLVNNEEENNVVFKNSKNADSDDVINTIPKINIFTIKKKMKQGKYKNKNLKDELQKSIQFLLEYIYFFFILTFIIKKFRYKIKNILMNKQCTTLKCIYMIL